MECSPLRTAHGYDLEIFEAVQNSQNVMMVRPLSSDLQYSDLLIG